MLQGKITYLGYVFLFKHSENLNTAENNIDFEQHKRDLFQSEVAIWKRFSTLGYVGANG